MNIVKRVEIDYPKIIKMVNKKYKHNRLFYFKNENLDGYIVESSGVARNVEFYELKPLEYLRVLVKDIDPSKYTIHKGSRYGLDFPLFYEEEDVQKAINNFALYIYQRDNLKEEI